MYHLVSHLSLSLRGYHTVEQCTTGQNLIHHAMVIVPSSLRLSSNTQVGHHTQDLANCSRLHEMSDLDAKWEVPGPNCFHQEQAFLLGSVTQDPGLRCVHSKGLLAKNMLAGFQSKHRVLKVVRVWTGHIYRLDIGIVNGLFVSSVCRTWSGNL